METSDDPVCGKCGAPIESGFQFAMCPHKTECALFPTDVDSKTRDLAENLIGQFK